MLKQWFCHLFHKKYIVKVKVSHTAWDGGTHYRCSKCYKKKNEEKT